MDGQNAFTALHVGALHDHASVEATRAQQCRIEHVGAIGRSDQDHTVIRLKAVHLDQQLVERLFALVVTAAQTSAAMASDRVNFVNEDDAGRVLFALFKQV